MRLLEQAIRVDAVLVELVAIGDHPRVHDLGRYLGVELDSETPANRKRLRTDVGLGENPCSGGNRECVEVPLEPGSAGNEVGVVRLDREPSNLLLLRPEDLAPERPGEQVASEADPEDRHIRLGGSLQQVDLVGDPFDAVLVGAELRPQRDDQAKVPRIQIVRIFLIDPEDLDLGAPVPEPWLDQPRRRRPLVLDHERAPVRPGRRCVAHRCVAHRPFTPTAGPTAWSFPSTAPHTSRATAAKRSTISASSSSVAVNAGAKSVWSPA